MQQSTPRWATFAPTDLSSRRNMDAQTNLNEVRSTLLRVADRLSSLQRQTPQSPSTINTAAATATSSRKYRVY